MYPKLEETEDVSSIYLRQVNEEVVKLLHEKKPKFLYDLAIRAVNRDENKYGKGMCSTKTLEMVRGLRR